MSSEYLEVAVARSTAQLHGWKPVTARISLGLVVLSLCSMVPALARAASLQSGSQPDSVARPLARSEQERADFNTAYALTGAATEEAAAIDFSNRYPTSELRRYLYSSAMLQYQRENNPAKMLAMGERVLALDPENPLALVLTATVLADSLGDHDRDRDKKISTIKHNASRAIQAAEDRLPRNFGWGGGVQDDAAVHGIFRAGNNEAEDGRRRRRGKRPENSDGAGQNSGLMAMPGTTWRWRKTIERNMPPRLVQWNRHCNLPVPILNYRNWRKLNMSGWPDWPEDRVMDRQRSHSELPRHEFRSCRTTIRAGTHIQTAGDAGAGPHAQFACA